MVYYWVYHITVFVMIYIYTDLWLWHAQSWIYCWDVQTHAVYAYTVGVYMSMYIHVYTYSWLIGTDMAMNQYLLIPFLGGWTSIYQLFWCSPGVQGFDTLPYYSDHFIKEDPLWLIEALASRSTATSVSCSTQTEEMKGASGNGNWWPPWGWRWVVNLACWLS